MWSLVWHAAKAGVRIALIGAAVWHALHGDYAQATFCWVIAAPWSCDAYD